MFSDQTKLDLLGNWELVGKCLWRKCSVQELAPYYEEQDKDYIEVENKEQ